jgi:hypothetical protein
MAWVRPYKQVRIDAKLYRDIKVNRKGVLRKMPMNELINVILDLQRPARRRIQKTMRLGGL